MDNKQMIEKAKQVLGADTVDQMMASIDRYVSKYDNTNASSQDVPFIDEFIDQYVLGKARTNDSRAIDNFISISNGKDTKEEPDPPEPFAAFIAWIFDNQ